MIKILHLYYDLMNLYGEYGNLLVLCDNLEKNHIEYTVDKLSIGDDIDFNSYDFIYCGSGTERKSDLAFNDFIRRKENFIKAFQNNKCILFTGSAMMLLGRKYSDKDGIGLFDFNVLKGDKRISGDVIASSVDYKNVVGYINSSFVLNNREKKYFDIIGSDDSFKDYECLGFKSNNLFAINITGPLFIKNPSILKDYIIKLGKINNGGFKYQDTINNIQNNVYNVTLNELKNRFNNN